MTVRSLAKTSPGPTNFSGITCSMHAQSGHPRFCSHTPFERQTPNKLHLPYDNAEEQSGSVHTSKSARSFNLWLQAIKQYKAVICQNTSSVRSLNAAMGGILKGLVASNVETAMSFGYLVYFRWLETKLRNSRDKAAAATALIWKADAHQGAACS